MGSAVRVMTTTVIRASFRIGFLLLSPGHGKRLGAPGSFPKASRSETATEQSVLLDGGALRPNRQTYRDRGQKQDHQGAQNGVGVPVG